MIVRISVVGLALALASCVDHVGEGMAEFDAGRLPEAIASWEAAPAPRSGVVEYDLGVARYRSGDLPRAIARFRAAARLRPRDGNVQHNLALARAGLEQKNLPEPYAGPGWQSVVTPGELGVLAVLVTMLGSALCLPRRTRAGGAAALAAGLVIGGTATAGGFDQRRHPVGVVVDQEAVLRDSASVNAGERLRLPVGTEVRVERRIGEFVLLEDGRGRRGWAPANGVETAWGSREHVE